MISILFQGQRKLSRQTISLEKNKKQYLHNNGKILWFLVHYQQLKKKFRKSHDWINERNRGDKNPPKSANMKTLQVQNQNFKTKFQLSPQVGKIPWSIIPRKLQI